MQYDIGNKTLDARILEVLKNENGFSTDDLGTYFYKDVLKFIIYSLIDIRTHAYDLKKQVWDMDMSLLMESQGEYVNSKDDLYRSIYKQRKKSENNLREQLQSHHSTAYFYTASKINDISIESFHENIKKAAFKTRLVRERKEYENNYMVLAFGLVECILISMESDLITECCVLDEQLQKLDKEVKFLQAKISSGDNNDESIKTTLLETQKEFEILKKQYVEKEKFRNILASSRDEDFSKLYSTSSQDEDLSDDRKPFQKRKK